MLNILRVSFMAISVMLLLNAGASWGEMRHDPSTGESKIEKGIKATLKVTLSKPSPLTTVLRINPGRAGKEIKICMEKIYNLLMVSGLSYW